MNLLGTYLIIFIALGYWVQSFINLVISAC